MRDSVCALIDSAAARSASQSGTLAEAVSRFLRTHQSAWSCQCAFAPSATKRAAASGCPPWDGAGTTSLMTGPSCALRLRQHLGDVHDAERLPIPPDEAVEVHQARHVD